MAFDAFKKKSFMDRMKDTGYLLKNSFTIIGKDKDIKTPALHMIRLSIIMRLMVYIAILLFILGKSTPVAIVLVLIPFFILKPYAYFYNTRKKADMGWIVYNTACGKDISYEDARNHTSEVKGTLRIIALVDLIMAWVKSQKSEKKGIVGIIINLFLSFLGEVWDLLNHYMIPAVVIEQKSLKEVVPNIKELRHNVPATLTGVFGIDFVGNVIGALFASIFFAGLVLSIGIGYLLAPYMESYTFTVETFTFTWIPVYVTLVIISMISAFYNKSVESIKVIYFTIFYTSIMRPEEIAPDMKEELTNYLLMGNNSKDSTESIEA